MSWYPLTKLTFQELTYCKSLEQIFRVEDALGEWVPYKLQPHQVEWHIDDVALKKENAPQVRAVKKSRNTSFTMSSVISSLMAVPLFDDNVSPVLRLNQQRANDLIKDEKKVIKKMQPIVLEDGSLYPFDPKKVDVNNKQSIIFPNGCEHRAFPANSSASDIIRGFRIRGHAGNVDESNFFKDFDNIYTALRHANAGSKNGKGIYQFNVGTTLRGLNTPYYRWLQKQERMQREGKQTQVKLYEWPIFDPQKFNKEIEPLKQPELVPIVPWQDMMNLNQTYLDDEFRFMEEYMGMAVDSEVQFYVTAKVIEAMDESLENIQTPTEHGKYIMTIDPAGEGGDYFASTIFEERASSPIESVINGHKFIENINEYFQRYLYYDKKKVDLEYMTEKTSATILTWIPFGLHTVRVDANGIGYQLGQTLQKRFPNINIELIRGGQNVKIEGGRTITLKEHKHEYHKKLLTYNKIHLLNDEIQQIHYTMVKRNYEILKDNEYGHGDICDANTMATLPVNWKNAMQNIEKITSNLEEATEKDYQTIKNDYAKMTIKEKLRMYRQGRR